MIGLQFDFLTRGCMKKLVYFIMIVFLFTPAMAQPAFKLVYFNNFAQFSWETNEKMQGILIDVLTEAIQNRMGIAVSHKGYPWKRAQLLAKNNHADAFVGVSQVRHNKKKRKFAKNI
jgi:polar amino acid transport system substrate-binding protein